MAGSTSALRTAAVARLAVLRSQWVDTPENLIRAARHYEGAGQRLISLSVATANAFVTVDVGQPTALDEIVRVEVRRASELAVASTVARIDHHRPPSPPSASHYPSSL